MEWLYGIVASIRKKGRDWAGIALSLLIAFGVWLLTSLGSDSVAVLSVNVTAVCDLEGRMDVSTDMARIMARCRASGYRIRALRRHDSRKVRIQQADLHPTGTDAFYITAASLEKYVQDIYGDVRLENFISDTVVFHFPPQTHKTVPVVPVRDIRFRSQYVELNPIRLDPETVTVYGDPLLLERITQVRTEVIRLSDVASSIQDFVQLDPIPGTRYSTPSVKYSLSVSRAVEIAEDVAVRVVGAPEDVIVRTYPEKVRLSVFTLFPMRSDPLKDLVLEIPYEDFLRSRTGDCVPRIPDYREFPDMFRPRFSPQVVHCVEEARK